MSRARHVVESVREVLKSWGREQRASVSGASRAKVLVYWQVEGTKRLVGSLTQEQGEYVFRYDAAFRDSDLPGIAAFPDKAREYRERELWPFFDVRLPPLKRVDVQSVVAARNLEGADTLQLLGALASRSITTPYELRYSAS